MLYPPVFEVCTASAAVRALLGEAPVRLFEFGEAERVYEGEVPLPYAVWQQSGGAPENYLGDRPDTDLFVAQFDIYAQTASGARAVAEALRDAIEGVAHITSWRGDGRDFETQLFRFSFDVDWWVGRPVPPAAWLGDVLWVDDVYWRA